MEQSSNQQDRSPRYCSACGSGLPSGARFCSGCGAAVTWHGARLAKSSIAIGPKSAAAVAFLATFAIMLPLLFAMEENESRLRMPRIAWVIYEIGGAQLLALVLALIAACLAFIWRVATR